jgi:large subunit ribosomal protein L18
MKLRSRTEFKTRRHWRIRKKVRGTAERPRMAIMVSLKHMHVQFIDDDRQVTLASASTLGKGKAVNVDSAKELGKQAATAALAKGIQEVVVDRGGYRYHGRVHAIVEAVREAGVRAGSVRVRQDDAAEAGEADAKAGAKAGKEEK